MLEFRADTHTYMLDGIPVPSITQILKDLKLYPNYDAITGSARERRRGTLVHALLQAYDSGTLDYDAWQKYDATLPHERQLAPFMQAYQKFLKQVPTQWEWIESPVCGSIGGIQVAGTPDRIGTILGRSAVLDIKVTRNTPPECTALQTAAYATLWKQFTGASREPETRYALVLTPGDFRLIEYQREEDYTALEAAITLWNWIKRRN